MSGQLDSHYAIVEVGDDLYGSWSATYEACAALIRGDLLGLSLDMTSHGDGDVFMKFKANTCVFHFRRAQDAMLFKLALES